LKSVREEKMIPGKFEYFAPRTLDEAVSLLSKHADAKILSGGQSLIPLMKLRFASPSCLIDINRVPDLAYIRESDGFLRIGALARETDIEKSDLIRTRYPILFDTANVIADPLVRNRATVCGNVAHADPANDHPATMLAVNAQFVAKGPKGERTIPVVDFFTGLYTTALEPNEILTEIRVPAPAARSGGAYIKLERKVGDFATAAVAVQLTLNASGSCEQIGVALTNVGLIAIKARKAEDFLRGKKPDENSIKEAAKLAAQESEPREDFRGTEEYKRDLVRVLTGRAIRRALERASAGKGGN
jgi:carbon-monoxide dehydrogenase medium subunit